MKAIDKEINNFLLTIGSKKSKSSSYPLVINTSIGSLYIKFDSEGSTYSLYGNYIDNTEKAKEKTGHWKHNLCVFKKQTSKELLKALIKLHINKHNF